MLSGLSLLPSQSTQSSCPRHTDLDTTAKTNLVAAVNEVGAVAAGALDTPAAYQADSAASDVPGLLADFNALLAKLIAAGLMESE